MAEIRVCALSEIPDGGALRVEAGSHRLALIRTENHVYALDDRCSHAEASLSEGEVFADESEIECPRHGATFDIRTGEALTLPATSPVATYPVRIEGDQVIVEADL